MHDQTNFADISFADAVFRGYTSFRGREFEGEADFSRAVFRSVPDFAGCKELLVGTRSIAWWCSPLSTATSRTDGLPRRFGTGTPGAAINKGEQGLAPADLGGSTG
jgi:hypothetical protein